MQYEPKVFACGCTVTLESNDEDPTRTCEVFNLGRCGAHSLSASDAGPITEYVLNFKPETALAKIAPPTEAQLRVAAKALEGGVVSKKSQARRDYYAAHRADYGRYELGRLKRMLSREKDVAKISRLMKRIEKREVAMGVANDTQQAETTVDR